MYFCLPALPAWKARRQARREADCEDAKNGDDRLRMTQPEQSVSTDGASPGVPVQEGQSQEQSRDNNGGLAGLREEYLNLEYVEHGYSAQTLDLYLPPWSGHNNEPPRVLIYTPYAKKRHSAFHRTLVHNLFHWLGGYAFAFVNYRNEDLLTAIQDCRSAVTWLGAHCGTFKLNSDCFIALGRCRLELLDHLLNAPAQNTSIDIASHLTTSSFRQGVLAYL